MNISKVRIEDLITVEALTKNQERVFKFWKEGYNLILSGASGTGKTYLAMYLALLKVLDRSTTFKKVVIIRSIVPTRDIGFLPGDEEEKKLVYEFPYQQNAAKLTGISDAWDKLKVVGLVEFMSTSFARGITLDDSIVIVDEMQNLNGHELDTIITRTGQNCRMLFCGDYYQSDLTKTKEREGILEFLSILEEMTRFKLVEFDWSDIVRSDLVREYIMTKEMKKVSW